MRGGPKTAHARRLMRSAACVSAAVNVGHAAKEREREQERRRGREGGRVCEGKIDR